MNLPVNSEWKILDLEDNIMVNTKISVLKAQEMEWECGDYVDRTPVWCPKIEVNGIERV